jgi:hypothetical protein
MEDAPLHSGAAPDAAVVLPLFGVFLLMPPIITLFASGLDIHGVPLIVLYVFSVWIGLIVCAALLAKRLDPSRLEQATPPEVGTDVHRR